MNFRLRGTPSALNTIKAECDRKLGDFAFKIKAVPRGTPLFIVWGLCVCVFVCGVCDFFMVSTIFQELVQYAYVLHVLVGMTKYIW